MFKIIPVCLSDRWIITRRKLTFSQTGSEAWFLSIVTRIRMSLVVTGMRMCLVIMRLYIIAFSRGMSLLIVRRTNLHVIAIGMRMSLVILRRTRLGL